MTTGAIQGDVCECGRDPLRRVILVALALYLAPIAVVVLLIGGLGVVCCAVARWFERGPIQHRGSGLRRDGAAQVVSIPHRGGVVRSRSPGS